MNTNPARPISIKIDEDTRRRLDRLAQARRRSPHWIMREAIDQYLQKEERAERAWQEASQAWEDYQATGLHLTFEEADQWLDELARGHDAEPPPCHK